MLFKQLYFIEVVDLQCCINLCCIAKWFSYTYIYIFFHILFHYNLSQDIEDSSLCYRVGPCCLCTLYMIVCICWPQTPRPSIPPPTPFSLATTSLYSAKVSVILWNFSYIGIYRFAYGCISLWYCNVSCISRIKSNFRKHCLGIT